MFVTWHRDWCCRANKEITHLVTNLHLPQLLYLFTPHLVSFLLSSLSSLHPVLFSFHYPPEFSFLLYPSNKHFVFCVMANSILDLVGDDAKMNPRRTMELLWADATNHLPQTDGEIFLPRNVVDNILGNAHLNTMALRLA